MKPVYSSNMMQPTLQTSHGCDHPSSAHTHTHTSNMVSDDDDDDEEEEKEEEEEGGGGGGDGGGDNGDAANASCIT